MEINWRKKPAIIRELRIAWVIPELRPIIFQKIGLIACRWLLAPVQTIIIAPIISISMIGRFLDWLANKASDFIDPLWWPTRWIIAKERAGKQIAHNLFTPEEIQMRAYGKTDFGEILPMEQPND